MTGLGRMIGLGRLRVPLQPIAVDAYEARLLMRGRVWFVLSRGFVIGVMVGLVPLFFNDESAWRLGIAASLVGIASLGFALFVCRQMATAAFLQPLPVTLKLPRALRAYLLASARAAADRDRMSTRFELHEPGSESTLRLAGVDLRGAILTGIDLAGAELTGALLDEADLQAATLTGTVLVNASLRGTDLRGAKLERARLEGCRLDGATYDDRTVWPANVPAPAKRGAIHAKRVP
jgi:hypothetical protein